MICAATGHRPDKLGGYGDGVLERLTLTATKWLQFIGDRAPEKIISGMAQGWDTAVALSAIRLGIPLVCAIPFEGFQSRWPTQAQGRFKTILDSASQVHVVCEGKYAPWKMQKRNEWMVDNSDEILALWDGVSEGGTKNCIDYAIKQDKPIVNLFKLSRIDEYDGN